VQEENKGWFEEYRWMKDVAKEVCKIQKEIIIRYTYDVKKGERMKNLIFLNIRKIISIKT
jgi:hypothetical protein